jgi:hypothetical protein
MEFSMMTKFKTGLMCFLTVLFLVLPIAQAQADLMISPVRVVFEGRDRSATVQLLNMTTKTHTYRMNWLVMKMDEDGKYVFGPPDENDPTSVAKIVVFSPRQVTIQPHAYQLIRLSLRRPADLPPGEYRAHLAFTRLADFGPERRATPESGIKTELKVNVSFSIPVIVRSGEDKDLKISLNSPKLGLGGDIANQHPVLSIDVRRDAGKFSSYGVLRTYWTPAGGQEKEIGMLSNVALYPEVSQRHLAIPLNENPDSGSLRVVYYGKYESEGTTWAEKTFPIGK